MMMLFNYYGEVIKCQMCLSGENDIHENEEMFEADNPKNELETVFANVKQVVSSQ